MATKIIQQLPGVATIIFLSFQKYQWLPCANKRFLYQRSSILMTTKQLLDDAKFLTVI